MDRLQARADITDALARFGRGVDARDWDLARTAYHPDAFDDHGAYSGGVDGLLADIAARHDQFARGFHFIGQSLFNFSDDTTAIVETYALVGHVARGEQTVNLTAGRYLDRFTFRDGAWRIQHRTVLMDLTWLSADASVPSDRPV